MRDIFETHLTIDHSVASDDGMRYTNTVKSLWALLKRAWFGSQHHYSSRHALSYVIKATYKWNQRRMTEILDMFIRRAVRVMA